MEKDKYPKKKSKTKQEEELKTYLDAQKKYNETGDKSLLWNIMYPILIDMLYSMIKKKAGDHVVNNIDDKVKDGALTIITRYIKNQNRNYIYPKTTVYWMAVGLLYHDEYDRISVSIDDRKSKLDNFDNIDDEGFVRIIN